MVTRRRLRSILSTLALYAFASVAIVYFGVNAYTGNRGLLARQELDAQMASLNGEIAALKVQRQRWERRIALLQSDRIDPDLLDERGRALLGYMGPKDLVLLDAPK